MPSGSRQALLEATVGFLAADITSGAASAIVTTRDGVWPTEFPFYVVLGESTIRYEIVRVDNVVGSTFTIQRAQLGTSASAHPPGESVSFNFNRADLGRMLARLEQVPAGGGTLANTVVNETSYGLGSTPGVSALYQRGDHTHGTPSLTGNLPAASAPGDTAATGTGTTPARDDHRHAREAFGSPGSSAVGHTVADGVATTPARSDHRHGREAFGSPVASGVGDSGADGAATTLARADHRHQREGFGAVTAETAYGLSAANGAASSIARSDHAHGTPTQAKKVVTFSRQGVLSAPILGALRWYANRAITLVSVRASVGSAPTGSAVIVDVNKNAVTIFTTQANRPTIPAAGVTDLADAIDLTSMAAGDYLTVDIDQAGSTTPGSDLTVQIEYVEV